MKEPIALLGVPSSAGARKVGQELAPRALRRAGLPDALRQGGREVVDLGDLPEVLFAPDGESPNAQNLGLVRSVVERVAEAVDSVLADGSWPLVLGGDCTITIGVLAALTRRFESLGLVYLDGDVDLNTPTTTRTGILDGMALAHALGEGAEELSRQGARHPLLEERNLALFGYSVAAGGIDPAEVERLKGTGMARYPLETIRGRARAVAEEAVRELEGRVDHILVHFDVDVIDASEMPAVDVAHSPGLTLSETRSVLRELLASPKVVGLVVTEFNARMDSDGKLARELIDLLKEAVE